MVGLFVIDITVKMEMGDNSINEESMTTGFKSSLFKMVLKKLSTNYFDTPELLMSAPVENNI